ncbi:hypothetical protein Hanom_Chr09g00824731 [Helianthus anomalus]
MAVDESTLKIALRRVILHMRFFSVKKTSFCQDFFFLLTFDVFFIFENVI